MKISSKKSKKGPFALVALAIIALSGGWLIYNQSQTEKPSEQQPSAAQNNSAPAAQTTTEPTKSVIRLTDSVSLEPQPGDYTADDHIWRLVDKTHPLTNLQYRPNNLQLATVASRTDKSTDERSLRADIMPAVEKLFADARAAGFELEIGSGFRSYNLQNTYYTSYVANYGQAAADTFSAKPGHSEHQTGLAMDLTTVDRKCYLDECFGDTAAGRWLAENAHKYGFVLSYPKGKEAITGYQYEPWHFRYVGVELATALSTANLTLGEATPLLLRR